jgi:hypothetical protein
MHTTVTKAAVKVIPKPINELVGVMDTEVPRFPDIIRSAYEGTAIGYDLELTVRESVRKNIETFAKVIRHSGGTPLLIELAVINDERMTHYLAAENSRKADPFFVSDIISYGDRDNGDRLFLDAWHHAIKRLGDPKLHDDPQMIVPCVETYLQGYVLQDLETVSLQALDEFIAAERTTDSMPEWPEQKSQDRDRVKGKACRHSLPSLLANNQGYKFREKYDFRLEEKRTPLEVPVERLTRGFIYYLLKGLEERCTDQTARTTRAKELLEALSGFRILIVPFRRPMGGSQSRAELGDSARPGGCVFVVFCDSSSEYSTDLELLSLRFNYVLSRAALSEAFSDIDLKEQRSKAFAVTTHALKSRALTIKGTLMELRPLLDRVLTDEVDRRGVSFAERAAIDLVNLADVSRTFQKIKEGDMQPLTFNLSLRQAFAMSEFQRRISMLWNDAKVLVRQSDAGEPVLLPSGALPNEVNVVQTDDRYLSIILSEVVLNILKHGVELSDNPPRFEFKVETESNQCVLWLRLENPATRNPEELTILRFRMGHSGGKIGMAVLQYAAASWGLPEPRFELSDSVSEPMFIAEVPLGLVALSAVGANAS